MSDKTNEKKIVTKDFLQKYQQKSFQTISKADFDKLSQAEKDCGITYYIYDKDKVHTVQTGVDINNGYLISLGISSLGLVSLVFLKKKFS